MSKISYQEFEACVRKSGWVVLLLAIGYLIIGLCSSFEPVHLSFSNRYIPSGLAELRGRE